MGAQKLVERGGNAVSIDTLDYLPLEAKKLIWKTFFGSRNRGVCLEHHFPWINDTGELACVSAYDKIAPEPEICATLVVKNFQSQISGPIGILGLVCVGEFYRGKQISTQILETAIEYAKCQAIRALTLWTSKPQVYEKVGFLVDEVDLFGPVSLRKKSPTTNRKRDHDALEFCISSNNRGVPAFAKEALIFQTNAASVFAYRTEAGYTVTHVEGDHRKALAILERALPDTWHLNAVQGSSIIQMLVAHGYALELQPASVRMTLNLNKQDENGIGHIPFEFRI